MVAVSAVFLKGCMRRIVLGYAERERAAMRDLPPYTVILPDQVIEATELAGAIATASDHYDPSDDVPVIVNRLAEVMFDQSKLVELILLHRCR